MLTAFTMTRGIAAAAALAVGPSLVACQASSSPAPAPAPTPAPAPVSADAPGRAPAPAAHPTVVATSAVGAGELSRSQLELVGPQACRATVSLTTREERFDVTLAPLGAQRAAGTTGEPAGPWTTRAIGPATSIRLGEAEVARILPAAAGSALLDPDGAALARLERTAAGAKLTDRVGRVVGVAAGGPIGAAIDVQREGRPVGAVTGTADPSLALLLLAPGIPPVLRAIWGCEHFAASSNAAAASAQRSS